MFYGRPLIFLFFVATIVVDLALLAMRPDAGEHPWPLGLLLGQAALVARWAAIGNAFRLARGAWAVAMVGLLACLLGGMDFDSFAACSAFLTVYVLILIAVTLVVHLIRFYWKKALEPDTTKSRWRISVMELFGWTLVVAIVSYSLRFMDFRIFYPWMSIGVAIMAVMLAVPVAITLVVKNDLRDLNRFTSPLLLAAFCGAGFYGVQIAEPFFWLIGAQAFYLLLWFFVRGLDHVAHEASVANETTESEAQ